jgi:hypothetical protein
VFLASLWLAPLVLAGTGCSGTGDGGTGDPQSAPNADLYGDGARLSEINGDADWYNEGDVNSESCDVPADRTVRLTGQVIVALDRYDETGEGATGNIYVQDARQPGEPALPYSGMTVFGPSFTPPNLRLFEGDVVDTFGTFLEFLGPTNGPFGSCKTLPEVTGTMSFRFEGGLAEPHLLVPGSGTNERWAPLKSYQAARPWMGMLVRIENVTAAAAPFESNGRFNVDIDVGGGINQSDIPRISNELYDIKTQGPEITQGTQFRSVTGVLTYFYGFRIAPRSPADFEL